MTGTLKSYDGKLFPLPVLTQYTVDTGDKEGCGSFYLRFAWDQAAAELLGQAAEFTAVEAGKTVFTGVVDEVQLELDRQGLVAEVTGRSLQARLLDNQVVGTEFLTVHLEDILSRYVRPFGVNKIVADALPPLTGFLVETGSSAWQVLRGFCRHSAGVAPRMLPDGTLQIQKNPAYRTWQVGRTAGYVSCKYRAKRYGRISKQILVDQRKGTQIAAQNKAFLSQGGRRQAVTVQSGALLRASWRTAEQRIANAEREAECLELTLPGGFLAWPGDRVEVSLEEMGIHQALWVQSAVTELGANGLICTVVLGKEN